jgi:glycerol uptake facilitator-like aquaporin
MAELSDQPVPLARRVAAEVAGTAVLTFVATAVSGSDAMKAAAPALVVGALVFTLGSVSGGRWSTRL